MQHDGLSKFPVHFANQSLRLPPNASDYCISGYNLELEATPGAGAGLTANGITITQHYAAPAPLDRRFGARSTGQDLSAKMLKLDDEQQERPTAKFVGSYDGTSDTLAGAEYLSTAARPGTTHAGTG